MERRGVAEDAQRRARNAARRRRRGQVAREAHREQPTEEQADAEEDRRFLEGEILRRALLALGRHLRRLVGVENRSDSGEQGHAALGDIRPPHRAIVHDDQLPCAHETTRPSNRERRGCKGTALTVPRLR